MCRANLADIITDIADRCGVEPSELDLSQIATDDMAGFVLGEVYTGAQAIAALRNAFFFDPCEVDGVVRFVKRGGASALTLTEDDLVDDPDRSTREQSIEYPRKLHLSYQNAELAYVPVKATAARSSADVRVVGEAAVEVPVILTEAEAAEIADKQLKVAWTDAEGETRIEIPDQFLRLTPTDIVTLNLRGTQRRLRIEKIERSEGVLSLTARSDRQSAYTSNAGSQAPGYQPPTPPPASLPGESLFVVLDIPALVDTHDTLGLYVAARGDTPAWYGCQIQLSYDAGANYAPFVELSNAARIGVLMSDVTAALEGPTDTGNRVVVDFGSLDPAVDPLTDFQWLNEEGAFAILRDDGTAEILQYRDVEEDPNQPGLYTLSHLQRGRLATGATAHSTGALVVMLDDVTWVPIGSIALGQDLTFRAISFGLTSTAAAPKTITYAGRSQIEFAPLDLELSEPSSDGITATWVRRDRLGTDVAPITSVNWQGYRVTFTGDTTITVDTTATTITQDVSTLGTSEVTVSVAQLNRFTGAGPTISASI